MTRQEKRAFGDLRHRDRKQRLQKLLAAKSRPQTTENLDTPALVIGVGPGVCTVSIDGDTRLVRCEIPVAPGDEVSVRHEKVTAIAPRRTALSRTDPANPHRERTIAANIDLLLIVAAIAEPPFRPGLVDRYLIAAARGGVQPILCLNKIDLGGEAALEYARQLPVVRCSTRTGEGIEQLRGLLAGSLAVLAGHSGVGKSSILNALADAEQSREGRGTGLHTTSASRLYELRNGARIIDTPGIREFGLGPVTLAELRSAFPEFTSERCRFRDCSHREEPDCAVRRENGPRYRSYLRLVGEM